MEDDNKLTDENFNFDTPENTERMNRSLRLYQQRHSFTKGVNKYVDFEFSYKAQYSDILKTGATISFSDFILSQLKIIEGRVQETSICLELSRREQGIKQIETAFAEEGSEEYDTEGLNELKKYCYTGESSNNEFFELMLNSFSFNASDLEYCQFEKIVALNILKQTDLKVYNDYLKLKINDVWVTSRHREFLLYNLIENFEDFIIQKKEDKIDLISIILGTSATNIRKRPPFLGSSRNDWKRIDKDTERAANKFWEKKTPKKNG